MTFEDFNIPQRPDITSISPVQAVNLEIFGRWAYVHSCWEYYYYIRAGNVTSLKAMMFLIGAIRGLFMTIEPMLAAKMSVEDFNKVSVIERSTKTEDLLQATKIMDKFLYIQGFIQPAIITEEKNNGRNIIC